MNYLSLFFLIYVICVLVIYRSVSRSYRWIVLLCASLFFYLTYDVRYIVFLLFVAVSTFFCAKTIGKTGNSKKTMIYFILCLIVNVGVWFWIKGFSWWATNLNRIIERVGIGLKIPIPAIIVPIGISYYVLLAIGYLVDVYKKRIEAEDNFGKYLLFLAYFPTIVQGPISRYDQLQESLTDGKVVDYINFKRSLLLIVFGIIKKMVIADQIAVFVNYCFGNYAELQGVVLYVGALGYTMQLYMDFSGCVDICRGISALFGIELMNNFNGPYFSKTIKEFWSRWHISLSTWLREYVYIPLGGNRKGKGRKYANLLVTFFVSGIWHGSTFNYIIWGVLQGVFQIIGECTYTVRKKVKKCLKVQENSFSDDLYRVFITFHLTVFSWIIFRSDGYRAAIGYIVNMFRNFRIWVLFDGSLFSHGISFHGFIVIFINICFVILVEYLQVKKGIDVTERMLKLHGFLRWCCYFVLAFDIVLFGAYGSGYDAAGFLYGGY